MGDAGQAETIMSQFATDFVNGNVSLSLSELNTGLSDLSTALNDCGSIHSSVPAVQNKITALGNALQLAKIESAANEADNVLVGATNLANQLKTLATSLKNGADASVVAGDLGGLLGAWSAVDGPCTSEACKVVDGMLRIAQVRMRALRCLGAAYRLRTAIWPAKCTTRSACVGGGLRARWAAVAIPLPAFEQARAEFLPVLFFRRKNEKHLHLLWEEK